MKLSDSMQDLEGSIVAVVTPMHNDEDKSLDLMALKKLVEWHVAQGTQGIVACGTTGESPTLLMTEWEAVVKTCVEASKGKIPIIAGTGTNSTKSSIERTERALNLGADAAMLVTPYYNKPTQEGMYQHFAAVANAVPKLPLVLYNVPSRTVCDMLPETVARLSRIPSIVAVKESSGNTDRIEILENECEPGFKLFTGEDSNAVEAILRGAHGVISVVANALPAEMAKMCSAARCSDAAMATKMEKKLKNVTSMLFLESNPIPIKWLLEAQNKIPAGIRLPLTRHSKIYHNALLEAYVEATHDEKKLW